jgi:hypothetical protein
MAIPNKVRGGSRLWVRAFICSVGLIGIVWGCRLIPVFWNEQSPYRVASKLLQGQPFKGQIVAEQVRKLEAEEQYFCSPARLRGVLILRLALLNDAISGSDESATASARGDVNDAARAALRCAPADSFAWLVLFRFDVGAHGLQPNDVTYLRLSYALGPNEGWIALWRNSLSILMLPQLPDDLKDEVIDEFVKLVDTGQFYQQTVSIFANAPPAVRNRIVEKLRLTKSIPHQFFARDLYNRGIDVGLPGGGKPSRPWQ